MTGTVIGGGYTSTVVLYNPTLQNPATVDGSIIVSNSSVALLGTSGTSWTVTNNGLIEDSAASGDGIELSSGGVVSNANLITGGNDGIFMPGGPGTVTNTGTITGTHGIGIDIGGTGYVSNAAGGVIQGASGVDIESAGTVLNYGSISGSAGWGAAVRDGGTVYNAGAQTIRGASYGVLVTNATGTVTNRGAIIATASTGDGIELGAGGAVDNRSGNQIAGGNDGIFMPGGPGSVTNAGTITGTHGIGIDIGGTGFVSNATNSLIQGASGVDIESAGTVRNFGSIVGSAGWGVAVRDGGAVYNAGAQTIVGASYGVLVTNAVGTVTNRGAIIATASTGDGIELGAGGAVDNGSGNPITGGNDGIFMPGGPGTVTNTGTISGTHGIGIGIGGTGYVSNSAGGVIQGASGVDIESAGTVRNFGSIGGSAGWGVAVRDGGAVYNAGAQTIVGASYGVLVTNATGTVTNRGTIIATASTGDGIELGAGGTVDNGSGDQITGGNDGIFMPGGPGSVTNAGTIVGTHGIAIDIGGTGFVSNAANSLIRGASGVDIESAGTVLNFGSISGLAGWGVAVRDGGAVYNAGAQTIVGASYGVLVTNAAGTVTNRGAIIGTASTGDGIELGAGGAVDNGPGDQITGGNDGIFMPGGSGSVTNAGTITGTHGIGIDIGGSGFVSSAAGGAIRGASGVDIEEAGTVLNYGAITGSAGWGVAVRNGGMVFNAAAQTIQGATYGVLVTNASGTVNNRGTIAAAASTGEGIELGAGGVVLNGGVAYTNAVIAGTGGGVFAPSGATTIVNYGTIVGNVNLGNAANLVVDQSNAVFTGVVNGGGQSSTLDLEGATPSTISGIGTKFINFGTIIVNGTWQVPTSPSGGPSSIQLGPNGNITLTGTVSEDVTFTGPGYVTITNPNPGNNTITNIMPGDTIHLPGVLGNGVSVNGTQVNVTQNGTPTGAFKLSAVYNKYVTREFSVAPDGTSGTKVILDSAPKSPEDLKRYGEIADNFERLASAAEYASLVAGSVQKLEEGGVAAVAELAKHYGQQLGWNTLTFVLTKLGLSATQAQQVTQFAQTYQDAVKAAVQLLGDVENPAALTFDIIGIAANIGKIYFQYQQNDPPDPNFTTVATPVPLSFPLPASLQGQPYFAALNNFMTDMMNVVSYNIAALNGAQKYEGALFAGDMTHADLQLAAYHQYSAAAAAFAANLSASTAQLMAQMPTIDTSSLPNYQQQIIDAVSGPASQQLSPDQITMIGTATGADTATIDSAVLQLAEQFDPNQVQNDLPAMMTGASGALAHAGPRQIPADFAGISRSDILWQSSNGNVALWEPDGASIDATAIVGFADPAVWAIRGTGDFDGNAKADILWQSTAGNVAIWQMNGFSVVASGLAGFADPAQWSIAAAGDFNSDGQSDILWHDTAGDIAIWQMNGSSVAGSGIIGFADPATWHIRGVADFNGDGKSDVLFQDNSGDVAIWQMNGTTVTSSNIIGVADPATWHIRGTGDFNGDGDADILWQDGSGDVAIWPMNGTTVSSSNIIGFADPTWHVAGIGDYNGDGTSDILWRNNSGNVAMWEMNNLTAAASSVIGFADPASWTIAAPDNTGDTTAAAANAASFGFGDVQSAMASEGMLPAASAPPLAPSAGSTALLLAANSAAPPAPLHAAAAA